MDYIFLLVIYKDINKIKKKIMLRFCIIKFCRFFYFVNILKILVLSMWLFFILVNFVLIFWLINDLINVNKKFVYFCFIVIFF